MTFLPAVLLLGLLVLTTSSGTVAPPDRMIGPTSLIPTAEAPVDVSNSNNATAAETLAPLQENYKWYQPPEPTQPDHVFYGWNEFSTCCGPMVADDWVCTTTDALHAVRWWGSFAGWTEAVPPPEPFDHFHFWIWSDVPAGADEPFSHPGVLLHEVQAFNYTWQFAGWDYDPRTGEYETAFVFDVVLEESQYFHQEPGNIYWMSIGAGYCEQPTGPHPWGWKTLPRDPASPAPDDAVIMPNPELLCPALGTTWADVLGGFPIAWPGPEDSWDMAFELTGRTVVEELKWQQPPDPEWPGLHAHDWAAGPTYQTITLADQWLCEGGDVTTLRWYGNYEVDPTGQEIRGSGVMLFDLSIHDNIPGVPWCLPGPTLWSLGVPFGEVNETDTGLVNLEGSPIYRYEYQLRDPFPQMQGQLYWFDITALSVEPIDPPFWRWQEAGRGPVPILCPAAERLGPIPTPWQSIVWPHDPPWFSDLAFDVVSTFYGELTLKWSQPPQPYFPDDAFTGWSEMSLFGGQQIAADDWVCLAPAPVTDVHWWGCFRDWHQSVPPPNVDLPESFVISIWTDVPAGADEPFSHPGVVIHQFECAQYAVDFAGWNFDPRDPQEAPEPLFRFECVPDQSEWFFQAPGENVYWISIAASYAVVPEHTFGWKTRPRIDSAAPDDAVRIFEPTTPLPGAPYQEGQPIFWPTPQESWDLAFALTTVETVACCLTDGSCLDLPWMMCVEQGGDPVGPGTSCADTVCYPIKWAQPPVFDPASPMPECFWGWDELSHYDCCQIASADWPCEDDRPVTNIYWWGSYQGWDLPEPPPPDPEFPMFFHIGIWTDVPVGPVNFSHPGLMLHEWIVPRFELDERPVGCDFHVSQPFTDACFRYEFYIPWDQWFWQEPSAAGDPSIYWVSVAAIYEPGVPQLFPWGWKTRPYLFQDDAAIILEPKAPVPGAQFLEGFPLEEWDMSFVLASRPCFADAVPDGKVDVNDLVHVITNWGPVPPGDPTADITDFTGTGPPDGAVDVNDLNAVIVHWGPCP